MVSRSRHVGLCAVALSALAGCNAGAIAGDDSSDLTGAVSLFSATTRPGNASESDNQAVEVGVRFRVDVDGVVTSVRFYKGAGNTGSHTGHVWTASGTLLGSVTFAGESATGWQTATFATPVSVHAGQTYVASYHTATGHYADDEGYFTAHGIDRGALHALRDGDGGPDGVYRYGASAFPSAGWHGSNYWVDVTFVAGNAGAMDAGTPVDASHGSDAGPVDTGVRDTGVRDTGTPDTGIHDAAAPDTGVHDAGTPDAGTGLPDPGVHHCATHPGTCGYPDETSTGVPAGTILRRVPADVTSGSGWHWDPRGWIQIDGDGAVLDSIETTAGISVGARNVTIRNCLLDLDTRGQTAADHSSCGIRVTGTSTVSANVTIQHCTIHGTGTGADRLEVGIQVQYNANTGFQAIANNIYNMSTGIQTDAGIIRDNYIHDFGFTDWGPPDGPDHLNGTTCNAGGSGLTVSHNTIFNGFGQTDAISLFEDFGAQQNAIIDNNFVAGGGYTIYGGANAGGQPTHDIRITNNRIGTQFHPTSGSYGWLAAWNGPNASVHDVEQGNFWDDTGAGADGDYTGHP